MMQLPRISVVVPSFNQGNYIGETLESIFRQGYPRLEVVVIDGGSTDESLEVIERFSDRLAHWQSRPDNGQANAINIGAAHCSGDLIAWLNSDDFYWKDCLWTVAHAYLRHPTRGLYIGNGLRYNQGLYRPFCERHLALSREALIEGLDYILQPSTFFLRAAWDAVNGLDERLHYCMDWDIIIRIAQRYPVVLVNEFLAVSREYAETKTSGGGMQRAIEILNLAQTYSASGMTPGALFYLCETLLAVDGDHPLAGLKPYFHEMMRVVAHRFSLSFGNGDGFPQLSDSQDVTYLPFADASNPRSPIKKGSHKLPVISVITPSFNQAQFLDQTLASLQSQAYPGLEMIVIDGGSTDASPQLIQKRGKDLAYWVSEPDRGPAHAINKGFAQATGEVIGWLNSDDLLAEGALLEVGKAFAADPELDMVYANALYIDENNHLFLADHGHCKTGLYYGRIQPREMVPAYWKYIHAVPQPTVFFRRRLLDQCGLLDESFHFIFDFELFWRFMNKGRIQKIEKTLAFYRIHANAKTAGWKNFEIELYRFSRIHWPPFGSAQFMQTLRDFTQHFMQRKYPWIPARGFRFYCVAGCVALSAASLVGNPERLPLFPRRPKPAVSPPAEALPNSTSMTVSQDVPEAKLQAVPVLLPAEALPNSPSTTISQDVPEARLQAVPVLLPAEALLNSPSTTVSQHVPEAKLQAVPVLPPAEVFPNSTSTTISQDVLEAKLQPALPLRSGTPRYHSFFCSYGFPRHPGHSGGEIRDFHILRHLLGISTMEFYALYAPDNDPRGPFLEALIDRLFVAESVVDYRWFPGRAVSWLRTRNIPVLGSKYHFDAQERFPRIDCQVAGMLQKALVEKEPEFLFVSPQANPIAMRLDPGHLHTRFVMASYDVEHVRLRRMAESHAGRKRIALRLEAQRAARFERDNLHHYDGIIAVSQLDKEIFVRDYGFPAERVLVIDNGVDPDYFQFRARTPAQRPEIVYTGSFTYAPNTHAAWRLIRQIMPLVWERYPSARLWVVGQSPGRELEAAADGDRIVVTGRVKDVRPYLAGASLGCVPLVSGSGTKYKVLEALSAGVPVVCSPIAAEGLELRDGEQILVRQTDLEIATAMVQLLDDPAMAQQMARRGRALVETRYAWDAFLPRLDDWLDYLAQAPLLRMKALG